MDSNSACREWPVILNIDGPCAPAISGESFRILVGHHTIGLFSCCFRILLVAKAVNGWQMGQ